MRRALFVCVFLLAPTLCAGRTVHLDPNGTGDYPTIQAAINDSNHGDIIILQPGIYTDIGNRDINYLGKAITIQSSDPNDWEVVAATVIDCNGNDGNDHRGFYFHSSEDTNSVLAGVKITRGSIFGGGIYCYQSSPTITNCIITNNTASNGGGVCFLDSNAIIQNCIIAANKSDDSGGGIIARGGAFLITNCLIIENVSIDREGGGINCARGIVSDCVIADNRAGPPVPPFNQEPSVMGQGAGIYCYNSTIRNCTITGNRAGGDGGGIWVPGSDVNISNCIIAGNTSGYEGGAISGPARVTNCTIVDNIIVSDSISAGNNAISGAATVTNSIILPERFVGAPEIDGAALVSYSCVKGGRTGTGNIDADPTFALDGDYHFFLASPCVDAGTNDPCGGLPPTDIEGNSRPLDGDGDGSSLADMGAYEYDANRPSIAVYPRYLKFVHNPPNPEPQKLLIRNAGGQPLHWQITEDCNWLAVSPDSSTSSGEINEVTVSVDSNSLPVGDYYGSFFISDQNTAAGPIEVFVILHIGRILRVPGEYATITSAMNAAVDYDVVMIADGLYNEPVEEDKYGHKNKYEFSGKAIRVRSENGPENCIIDCNGGAGFKFFYWEDEHSVLDGLTITEANTLFSSYYGWRGGAIETSDDACPTISNCIIRDCNAGGGAVVQGRFTLKNCIIRDNTGQGVSGGRVTIANCDIINNKARPGNLWGGGLSVWNSSVTGCRIIGNIMLSNGYGAGGGIWLSQGAITDSIIAENYADGYGGGIFLRGSSGTPYVTSLVENCVISGNAALCGGGVYSYGGKADISNCTIVGNKAGSDGGGGIAIRDSSTAASIRDSIICDNRSPLGSNIARISGTLKMSHTNVTGGPSTISPQNLTLGPGNIDVDPYFVEPGYWDANGTPGDMNDDFWVDGDYHLKSEGWRWDKDANQWTWDEVTSRCIDAGNPGTPLGDEPTTLSVDPLNRFGRNLRIDMGSYGGTAETSMPPPGWTLLADLTNDGTVNFNDYVYQAADWQIIENEQPGDLNRDGRVTLADTALLVAGWLAETTWH